MLGFFQIKKLRTIIIIYWFLLAYIIAALIYWFLLLNQQNNILIKYKEIQLNNVENSNSAEMQNLALEKKRKQIQYLAEGTTFLLLIITGALFVYRAVRRQLQLSHLQHNFMMALTHELKTPIAVTKLNLETLKKRSLSTEVQQKLIVNTLQEANRLNDLCSNMLLASQLEAGGYIFTNETLQLSELLQQCCNEFKVRYPERNFLTAINPDINIIGDKMLLQIAINNILDNAIKYSLPKTIIKTDLQATNTNVVLKIIDNGNGIPDTEKQKIFKKFYRLGNQSTKEAKGTGLGLFLSRTIVKESRGHINVYNNSPVGSIFELTFPLIHT